MDRVKKISYRKMQASTILETVVSMVLLIIVFALAMTIYLNVTRTSLSLKAFKARKVLNEVLKETEQTTDFIDKTVAIDSLQIEQRVRPYEHNVNLVEVELTAFDINHTSIERLKKVEIR